VESGSGEVDFTNHSLEVTLHVGGGGVSVTETAVYVDGVAYVQLPSTLPLPQGKSWVSMDAPADPGSGSAASIETVGGNPAAILQLLTSSGNTATALGSTTIDGQSVQGYEVTVSPATVAAEVAKLPAELRQLGSEVKNNGITADVYINGAGELVRESETTSASDAGTTIDVTSQLDLSNYGTPVSVTAPPPSEVTSLQQLLSGALSSPGS
jgi:hypothetical protein